jgi:predicted nucleotidyltransferase
MRLRGPEGVSLGEVFTYLSALYFRGKLAYARTFADPPSSCPGILIITPTAGLLEHDAVIHLSRLRGFGRVPIHLKNRTYRAALRRSARELINRIGPHCEIVLLGSVATGKYLDILAPIFGRRFHVPGEFVGLGDMARGGLLLRCVRENRQLSYVEVASVLRSESKRIRRKQKIVTEISGISHDDAASEKSARSQRSAV